MAKAVFDLKKLKVITVALFYMQSQRNHYWRVNSEPMKSEIICTLQKHSKKNFGGNLTAVFANLINRSRSALSSPLWPKSQKTC